MAAMTGTVRDKTKAQINDIHECIPSDNNPPGPQTLRRFPPEIREMIFEMALTPSDDDRMTVTARLFTPALIVALRGSEDGQLYQEALQAFCKNNFYSLSFESDLMSDRAKQSIRKLDLDIAKGGSTSNAMVLFIGSLRSTFRKKGRFVEARMSLNYVATRTIIYWRGETGQNEIWGKIVKEILQQSQVVQKLCFVFTTCHVEASPAKRMEFITRAIGDELDVEGVEVVAADTGEGTGTVTWIAGAGKALRWTET